MAEFTLCFWLHTAATHLTGAFCVTKSYSEGLAEQESSATFIVLLIGVGDTNAHFKNTII